VTTTLQHELWDAPAAPPPAVRETTITTRADATDLAALLLRHAAPREVPMLITWVRETNPTDVVATIRRGPTDSDTSATSAPPHVTWDESMAATERARKDAELALSEAGEFAAWLTERVAPAEVPNAIARLRRAKAKDVVEALRANAAAFGGRTRR
jgi:hypothetical protein